MQKFTLIDPVGPWVAFLIFFGGCWLLSSTLITWCYVERGEPVLWPPFPNCRFWRRLGCLRGGDSTSRRRRPRDDDSNELGEGGETDADAPPTATGPTLV